MKKIVHVVMDSGGQWIVRRGGSDKSSVRYSTQKEALQKAQERTKHGGTLVVHNRKGEIREVMTYRDKDLPRIKHAKVSSDIDSKAANNAIAEAIWSKQEDS